MAPEPCAPAEPRLTGRSTNALREGGGLATHERLDLHGADALADEELLAILVGASGVEAAGALIEACGRCSRLAHESTGNLARIKSMTPRGLPWSCSSTNTTLGDPTPSVDDIALTERLQQAEP